LLIHDRQTYEEQRDATLSLLDYLSTLWHKLLTLTLVLLLLILALLLLILLKLQSTPVDLHPSNHAVGDLLSNPSGPSTLVILGIHHMQPSLHPEEHSRSGTGIDVEYTVLTEYGQEQRVTESYLSAWLSSDNLTL